MMTFKQNYWIEWSFILPRATNINNKKTSIQQYVDSYIAGLNAVGTYNITKKTFRWTSNPVDAANVGLNLEVDITYELPNPKGPHTATVGAGNVIVYSETGPTPPPPPKPSV